MILSLDLLLRAKKMLDDNLLLPDAAIIDGQIYAKPAESNYALEFLVWHFGKNKI